MKNIIEQILDENNHDIIQIQGKNKEWLRFEQVALINLDEELYLQVTPSNIDNIIKYLYERYPY